MKKPAEAGFFMHHSAQRDHSHSIINKPPEPAWLKGLAEIEMGLTATSTVNRAEL
jgi:hypothetical protein